MQDDRQSEDLPLGSRGGIAIRHDFPVAGEYLVQGPSPAAVSGLPQGHGLAAAARRPPRRPAAEAVHGRRQGAGPARRGQLCRRRRARLCRRRLLGKVHADRAATPGWRSACRWRRARTSSACRSSGRCGSRKAFRSRCSGAGSSRTTRSTWTTRTSGSVQIGGPYDQNAAEPAKDTPSRRAIFVCQPKAAAEERGLRHEDPVTNGAARVSPAGDERGRADAARLFRDRPARRRKTFDAGIQFALERMLVDPDFLLRVSPRSNRRRRLSDRRSRLAAVVLPVEQHSRRAAAHAGRARDS